MLIVRQSTARAFMVGPILDAAGAAVTDAVIGDLKVSKNGAAPVTFNGSATLTHRHTGHYSLAATATDLDTVGSAQVTIDDTVNGMPTKELIVIEEAIYDTYYAAAATGAVPVASIANNAISAAATATDFGTEVGTAVWASTTRVLTAATNLTSALATPTNITAGTITTLTNAPSDSSGVTTLLSRLSSARAGYLDNLSGGAVALASSLTSLAGKFTGITSLAEWLGLLAGKQTGSSTARTELRATGAGSGTFDETTDSIEAVRDNMGTLTSDERTAIANAVEAEIIDDTDSEKVLEAITNKIASVNPSLGDLTLSAIAAAVRDQGYAGAAGGSFGEVLAALAARLPGSSTLATASDIPSAADVRAEMDSNSTKLADILDDTVEIGAAGAGLTALASASGLDAVAAKTTLLPSAAAGANGGLPTVDGNNRIVGIQGTITTFDALDTAQDAQHATTQGRLPAELVDGRIAAIAQVVSDKTGYALTSGERTAIANEVEAQIIDDTDSEKVLQAIIDKIAAANPDLGALTLGAIASAVRSELAIELARIDAATSSRLASAGYTAPPSAATVAGAVRTDLTTELGHIDADVSSRATPAQVAVVAGYVDTEVAAILDAVNGLNDVSLASVKAALEEVIGSDVRAELTEVPAANAPLADKLAWLFVRSRNKSTLSASDGTKTIFADDDTTPIGAGIDGDDGAVYPSGKVA